MSNLKMPTMTYENLSKILGSKSEKKICYATEIASYPGGIRVTQHGNTIANISESSVMVTNAGWDSSTTANRLRKIMNDNNIGFYVRVRNFGMRLFAPNHTEVDSSFHQATFFRTEDNWVMGAA